MEKRKILGATLTAIVLLSSNFAEAKAYILNGKKLRNASCATYYCASNLSQISSVVSIYTNKWNNCSQVNLSQTYGSSDITLEGDLYTDTGVYANTSVNFDTQTSHVTFYQRFLSATYSNQSEIVVHEVGHALGLAHCASSDVKKSVMREYGFNGKAYPLSDDKAGIATLYN